MIVQQLQKQKTENFRKKENCQRVCQLSQLNLPEKYWQKPESRISGFSCQKFAGKIN